MQEARRSVASLWPGDARFASDAAVWEAVAGDPSLVVGNFGTPGQEVTSGSAIKGVTLVEMNQSEADLLGSTESFAAFLFSPWTLVAALLAVVAAVAEVIGGAWVLLWLVLT